MTTTPTVSADLPDLSIVHAICQAVAELPDRNSPPDWPEAMLVTHDELADIVRAELSAAAPTIKDCLMVPDGAAAPAAPATPGKMTREAIDRAAHYAIESDMLAPADWEAVGLYDFAHAITGGIGVVDDLRTLVVRLVRALRQAAPANDLADKAADYLRRHGLDGSPLRDSAAPQALATFSTHYSPQCQHLDPADASAAAAYARAQAAPSDPTAPFQQRVQPWLLACFGAEIAADRAERNHRFLEESLELVQSCGCTAIEAHQLVDYVYGRPVGEPAQETGGVMVTLAALCLANSLDMHQAGEMELARIWTKVEAIRAKQAAKPKHSPLPGAARAGAQAVPAGWKLVPMEPTEAMFTRFSQQIEQGVVYVGGFLQAYRCMLDVAPHEAAASATTEAAPVVGASAARPVASEHEIQQWVERHDLDRVLRGGHARAAFEDAQTWHLTPEASGAPVAAAPMSAGPSDAAAKGWLITYTNGAGERREVVSGRNSIADYRDQFPDANSFPLGLLRPASPTTVQASCVAAGHIAEPYTLTEIKAKIESGDYSAEMLLQHAMLLLEASPTTVQAGVAGKYMTVVYRDITPGDEARILMEHPKCSAASWSHALDERDAALRNAVPASGGDAADAKLGYPYPERAASNTGGSQP